MTRQDAALALSALLLVAWTLTVPALGAPAPTAADGGLVGNDALLGDDSDGNLTDTVENTTDSTTDAAENATDSTTDAVEETTGTTGTVDETTDSTTDAVENTTNATDETLNRTAETLTGSPTLFNPSTDGELDSVTGDLTAAVDETAETVDATADTLTATVTTATGTATEDVAPATDATPTAAETPAGSAPPAMPSGAASGPSSAPAPAGDGSPGSVPGGAAVALGTGAVLAGAALREGLVAGSLTAGVASATAPVSSLYRRALDRLFRLAALLRYSAYDDSDPLEHEARAAVYEAVTAAPGSYLSEVSERSSVSLSTVRYHARVLEKEGLIASARLRGRRRLYPADVEHAELAAALNDEATASVLDALSRLGAASVSDLAAALDRDPSTVSHHLSRLAEDDLVVRERDGRAKVNRLAPPVRDALAPDRESAPAAEPVAPAD